MAAVDDLRLGLGEMEAYQRSMVDYRQGLYRVGDLADYEWASIDGVGVAVAVDALSDFLLGEVTDLELVGSGMEFDARVLGVLDDAGNILRVNVGKSFAESLRRCLQYEAFEGDSLVLNCFELLGDCRNVAL